MLGCKGRWIMGMAALAGAVLGGVSSGLLAAEGTGWGRWQGLAEGFVARRREPPPPRRLDQAPRPALLRAARAAPGETADALWLEVRVAGLQQVSVEDLAAAAGQDVDLLREAAARGRLRLDRQGKRVQWRYDEAADAIAFVSAGYDDFYTEVEAYRLRIGASGKTMKARKARPRGVGEDRPFREALHFEQEPPLMFSMWVVADEPDADYWFWDYLYAGSREALDLPLKVPDPAPVGQARLRVTLRGFTDVVEGDDHYVTAELNGVPVGEVSWDGLREAVLEAHFDQGLLDPAGDNTLTLRIGYAPGTAPGQFLDAVDLEYDRLPVAREGQLWLRAVDRGTQRVGGLGSDAVEVYELVRGGDRAAVLTGIEVEPDGAGGWAVVFEARGGRDYLVVEAGSGQQPEARVDHPTRLRKRQRGAPYLIIASRRFEGAAEALAEYRRARFGAAQVVWVEDIFDEFSGGRVDPHALARFMDQVRRRWRVQPRQVVLLGRGTLDQKDRMGYGDSVLPVLFTSTPWVLAPSDERLLGYADAPAPFAVSRLPITSDAEGLAYVQKLQRFEAAPAVASRTALLTADDPDDGGDFHANTQTLAAQLTGEVGFAAADTVLHPRQDVAGALSDSGRWETDLVTYEGHGSPAQLGDYRERFLDDATAAALGNTRLPVFLGMTCEAGNDTVPGLRALGAALVLNPGGGAIAAVAATGPSLDSEAVAAGRAWVRRYYSDGLPLGEAVRQTKGEVAGSVSAYLPRIYTVLGEPAVLAQ